MNLLTNDIAGTNPIDPATVVITRQPEHSSNTIVSAAGIITYIADTRFTGRDSFSYEVDDTLGNTSRNIATVDVQVRCDPPATVEPRFIYGGGNSIFAYNGGVVTTIHNAVAPSTLVNALATNRDDNLIYWAEGFTIFAYDVIANTQFTVIANASTDPRFTFSGDENFSSGGATYHGGVYYLCGSANAGGPINHYYRLVMGTYIPGSLSQAILNVTRVLFSDGLARDMGDLQYDRQAKTLIISGGVSSDGAASRTFSIFDPTSGELLELIPRAGIFASDLSCQIVMGVDDVLYANSVANIYTLNLSTGAQNAEAGGVGNDIVATLSAEPTDLAEYVCAPC
ncbi:Ig-like domain-containing protein [bacterium]|nr:Ig-like domain-containing protein [bacterium]